VVSANDIWAVGSFYNTSTLIEHWNGSHWSVVTSPNPGDERNVLYGIGVVSANDIWVVGFRYDAAATVGTLIEHWNGTSWSVVPSPNPGYDSNVLYGIGVVSANDIWAVGNFYNTASDVYEQTLIEHWNGTSWSVVPSPNPGAAYNFLYGIEVISANDIWAVGGFRNTSGAEQTLIEHWNGSHWSVVTSPSPGANGTLRGIAVVSARNIWAVGSFYNTSGAEQTLIEHWNGSHWSVVTSPNPGSAHNVLYGIAVASARNIWAVGSLRNTNGALQTLIEHITVV
jgi:hypothetical protein